MEVLRFINYDVETARDIGAEQQPDVHFKRAYKNKRVVLTHDLDYQDSTQFPLSQTRGVVILNVDTSDTSKIARALHVVDTIFGGMARAMQAKKIVVNSDYTITMIYRTQTDTGFEENRTRYRFDRNGRMCGCGKTDLMYGARPTVWRTRWLGMSGCKVSNFYSVHDSIRRKKFLGPEAGDK